MHCYKRYDQWFARGCKDVPGDLVAQYYAQRASAGLIIFEATQISAHGKRYPGTPGIYSDAQVAGWQKVAKALHAEGLPVAPSAVEPPGKLYTASQGRWIRWGRSAWREWLSA